MSNISPDLLIREQFMYHQLYACRIRLSQRSMSHFKFSVITIYSRQMSRMTLATWHNFRPNLYKLSNSCNQYLFKIMFYRFCRYMYAFFFSNLVIFPSFYFLHLSVDEIFQALKMNTVDKSLKQT